MPCVLPVIGLKIYGFIGQAGEDPRRVFRLGLAFSAGVVVFFLTLAAIVVAFAAGGHTLNYGLQFQNPYVLAGILAVVFVFSLSLLGVFEIAIGGDAASKLASLSQREGYGGAFMHGLFTTLLGTACTGPLLGPVLAIAFLRPGIVTFLVLGAMAIGMALPYVILTAKPAWMKFLPRPGVWMERLKQLMVSSCSPSSSRCSGSSGSGATPMPLSPRARFCSSSGSHRGCAAHGRAAPHRGSLRSHWPRRGGCI